jgi:hypothetical protein
MASTLLSPGVLARENDSSQVRQQPVVVGAAIIGPTPKGPIEIPTVVTSYSDYVSKFGDVESITSASVTTNYSYFTGISVYNYFVNGGQSMLVTRIVSGSYTAAASSNITNNAVTVGGVLATGSYTFINPTLPLAEYRVTDNSSIVYRFIATQSGAPADDIDGNLYFFASGSSASVTAATLATKINLTISSVVSASANGATFSLSGSTAGAGYNGVTFSTGSSTSFSTQFTLGGGVNGTGTSVAFVLETLSKGTVANSTSPEISGSLTSGSKDNLRWEIVSPNTASGTFTLLIRQGNDQSPNNKTIIEQFTNLSLDPFADNYIANVIGDYTYTYVTDNGTAYLQITGSYPNASRYVRVKSVNYTTPNYLNSYGAVSVASYTASLPTAGSGSFGGAVGAVSTSSLFYDGITNTNSQGLVAANYTNAIALLANKDDYQYNVLLTPGLINNFSSHVSAQSTIIGNTLNRGDALYVMDLVEYGSTVATVSGKAAAQDTSYAAAYWPWVQVQDPATGKNVWVPASTMIGGVYAYNDRVAEPWFAPAGINRGGLSTVIRAERKLAQSDRDTLYQNKVNPIATFPGQGVVVYGQKTLQAKPSALDRVNVRRLLIALKSYISQVANNLIFEQNTTATRNAFLGQVNPYLASVQQRQGLYAFKVVMDDTNNTPDVIDRNQLIGQIYLQPTKTAEFIYLDFNITPTGVSFA